LDIAMDESHDQMGPAAESGNHLLLDLTEEPDASGTSPALPGPGRKKATAEALSVADLMRNARDEEHWQESSWKDYQATVRPSSYLRWKQPLERMVGVLLFILSLPIIVVLLLVVRATSAGPGIYRQHRVGKDGRIFALYKIRTMRQDAETNTGPVWSQRRDPRATAVGNWMRALHLDELPQTLNVARGEMALIGPRPERPEFVGVLCRQVPQYLDRLTVLPGITGLAQVCLPADEALDGVRKKLEVDLEYIENAAPAMDAKIVASTALRLLGYRSSGSGYASQAARDRQSVEAA